MSNQKTTKDAQKPAKPHPDFPLFAHATGRWAKKVRGKLRYFGPWADPQAALELWLAQKDELLAGRTPRAQGECLTLRELVNRFLTSKQLRVDCGELSPRTFHGYHETCDRMVNYFGRSRNVEDLAADDFEGFRAAMAKTLGPVALSVEIQKARIVFKYGVDSDLLSRAPRYGQGFSLPNKKVMQKQRASRGKRLFEAAEIRLMIAAASPQLSAMILLGINAGFGPSDLGNLPRAALDLDGGWVEHPRPKTGVERRCPLWPETIAALRKVAKVRPDPKDPAHDGLVFITSKQRPWIPSAVGHSAVTERFNRLLKSLGIERGSFYWLRHTHATVSGDLADQVATNHLMGHQQNDMPSRYRQAIADERLVRVSDHVRAWLFPKSAKAKKPAKKAPKAKATTRKPR